jgi:hypothetical protein
MNREKQDQTMTGSGCPSFATSEGNSLPDIDQAVSHPFNLGKEYLEYLKAQRDLFASGRSSDTFGNDIFQARMEKFSPLNSRAKKTSFANISQTADGSVMVRESCFILAEIFLFDMRSVFFR